MIGTFYTKTIYKNVVIIDNRERLNYLEQHIPGAINIPYRTLATDGKILRTNFGKIRTSFSN